MEYFGVVVCTFVIFDSSLVWESLWNHTQDLEGVKHLMGNMEPFFIVLGTNSVISLLFLKFFYYKIIKCMETLRVPVEMQRLILSLEILQTR